MSDAFGQQSSFGESGFDAPVIVHAVGRLTDSVFRFLGPATEVLARSGARQVVVALEDPNLKHLAKSFPVGVQVILLPWRRNPVARWRRWVAAFRLLTSTVKADAIHLHGFIPSALVAPVLAGRNTPSLIYSPHGSRTHQGRGPLQRVAQLLARVWLVVVPRRTVVSLPSDAKVLRPMNPTDVHVVESPVADDYLLAPRVPTPMPLIAGGVQDDPAETAARFAQIAVLLGNGEAGLVFKWIGATNAGAVSQLSAAEIDVEDAPEPDVRATELASAWLYVAPSRTHGFPGHIAEAMACGLPVVAIDCQQHRDLIVNGKTGFLCSDDAQVMDRVRELVHDLALREEMGAAARAAAKERFSGERFGRSLLRTYSSAKVAYAT